MKKIFLITTLMFYLFVNSFSQKIPEGVIDIGEPINLEKTYTRTPSISLDGKTLIFASDRDATWKLYQCVLQNNGTWSSPVPIDAINNFGTDLTYYGSSCLSFDGNTLYFSADYPSGNGKMDIWYSVREGDTWGEPINMGTKINTAEDEETPSISADETEFYFVRDNVYAVNQDYVCRKLMFSEKKSNEWQKPIDLPSPVNLDCEQSPRICIDGKTLYFSSVREGNEGMADLFMTRKEGENIWSAPIRIDVANTKHGDQYASLTMDLKNMYYSISDKKFAGVYKVVIPEKYRPFPVMILTGTVMDSIYEKPLNATINIFENNSSEAVFSLKSNASDGKYIVVLNQGSKYKVEYTYPEYLSETYNFDATKITEAVAIETQINLIKPEMIFSGVIKDEISNSPVETDISIKDAKTDETYSTLKNDPNSGNYTFTLNNKNYNVEFAAKGYNTLVENYDLTSFEAYEKKPLDIQMIKTEYNISGIVKDSITDEPLSAVVTILDAKSGENVSSMTTNPFDGKYSVVLKQGKIYDVEFASPGYVTKINNYDLVTLEKSETIELDMQLMKPEMIIKGIVKDSLTNQPTSSVIKIKDFETNESILLVESKEATGEYIFSVPLGKKYLIEYTKEKYPPVRIEFDFTETEMYGEIIQNVSMNKSIVVENINFASGSAELQPESFSELDKVIEFLLEQPTVMVEVQAHTDDVGSPASNLTLSEKRAESVVKYIVSKGVEKERVIAKGYGLTQPLVPNDSPENRAKNRRVEMKVLN